MEGYHYVHVMSISLCSVTFIMHGLPVTTPRRPTKGGMNYTYAFMLHDSVYDVGEVHVQSTNISEWSIIQ